jgi:hypothetical protein
VRADGTWLALALALAAAIAARAAAWGALPGPRERPVPPRFEIVGRSDRGAASEITVESVALHAARIAAWARSGERAGPRVELTLAPRATARARVEWPLAASSTEVCVQELVARVDPASGLTPTHCCGAGPGCPR